MKFAFYAVVRNNEKVIGYQVKLITNGAVVTRQYKIIAKNLPHGRQEFYTPIAAIQQSYEDLMAIGPHMVIMRDRQDVDQLINDIKANDDIRRYFANAIIEKKTLVSSINRGRFEGQYSDIMRLIG